MGAISDASVRWNEAQLRPKRPQTERVTPPASSTPSTSTTSAFAGGVTLEAVIAQLQRMDAHLDTLTTKLYQVNTRVSRITQQQARLGGFVESPSPSLKASADENDDGDFGDNDNDKDEDASSSDDEEITTSQ